MTRGVVRMARRARESPEISAELLGLLPGCKDAPDDDAPRLVLADWLEERDGPTDADRAQFVRAQTKFQEKPFHSRGLSVPERHLLDRHRAEWCGPIGFVQWRRGLMDWGPTV